MSKPKTVRDIDIPLEVLKDLLTPSEIRMLKNRFHIIQLLEEGFSIRKIAEKVKVGTDTVVRVSRIAEKKEVRAFLDKNKHRFKTNTPWIFGKNE